MIPLVTLALLCAAPTARSQLDVGIQRYKAQDYQGALIALTKALDRRPSNATRARIHAYVGLIQVRYARTDDAAGSFRAALERNPRLRLPDRQLARAHRLFRRVKRKMGLDTPRRRRVRDRKRPEPAKTARRPASTSPIDSPTPPIGRPGDARTNAQRQETTRPSGVTSRRAQSRAAQSRPAPRVSQSALTPPPPPPPWAPTSGWMETTATAPTTEDTTNVAAWTTLGLGSAGIVTGLVFGGLAISNHQAAHDATSASRTADLTDTFQSQERAAYISLGVGTALAVGAVVWLALD